MNSATQEVDVLVIGAGAGGMTAALIAKRRGLKVLVCEKTDSVGGITATSGGTAWVPGTHLSTRANAPDSVEAARTFLSHVCAGRDGEALREAFLQSGPKMIEELDAHTDVQFVAAAAHPDYVGNTPGEALGGRALAPVPFDGRLLGEQFVRVRAPRAEFMGLGGMMVNRSELDALLNPWRSSANFKTTLGVVLPYFRDRLKHARGTRLVMGNALAGRLYYSLIKAHVPVWFEAALTELLQENGRITGAVINHEGAPTTVRARLGVVLATGGVGHHLGLRQKYFPEGVNRSFAPDTHTGDGVQTGLNAGALLRNEQTPALWFPTSIHQKQGVDRLWPHIILDRAKPGLFAVDCTGKRFVNESNSYHDFCNALIAQAEGGVVKPAYLIVDDAFIHEYGLGLVLPGARNLNRFIKDGYVFQAASMAELASKIHIDAATLQETLTRYNELAQSGVDTDFGRGGTVMNRFNGDARVTPNPCLRPVSAQGPYYALKVEPADLAASMGLACSVNGEVLNDAGAPIAGLFACGNDMASIFSGTYPGPGTTIGPAMVFGWRIAQFLSQTHQP